MGHLPLLPAQSGGEELLPVFGVLCDMALYNHNIVHLPFPLALFKKMVGVKPSLEDLREFDPVVGGYVLYFRMYILALNWYPLEMD